MSLLQVDSISQDACCSFQSDIELLISNIRAKQLGSEPQPKPTGVFQRKNRFYVRMSINGQYRYVGNGFNSRSEAEKASIAARLINPAMTVGVKLGQRMREAIEGVCEDQGFIEALWESIQFCDTRTAVAYEVGFKSLTALNQYLDRRGITEEFERRWRGKA